jgi:transposase
MRDNDLFQLALGITSPWFVASSAFDAAGKRLDIKLDFTAGSRFVCPECKADGCPVHDTVEKTWRHLDFFQHQAFLTARTPRITCGTCGVRLVAVPWARPGSGFTLLFEGFAMALAIHLPIAVAAGFLGITDQRLWRVVFHYVEAAVARTDLSGVTRVCIDETAAKRGHDYITLVVDIDGRRVVFTADGRSADTVRQFADHLEAQGGDASHIKQASIDMSPAFISGVTENLTEAEITFDRFHVMKLIGDAVDQVRRAEVKARPELKGTRYAWTKNQPNLTARQSTVLAALSTTNLKTARAWRMRLAFQDIYARWDRDYAELLLDRWIGWAKRSRLEPMKAVARTMGKHRNGILAFFDSRISNGLIEGINSLVQAAKAKARGYRNSKTLKAVTYLVAGKLDLKLPT